MNGAPAVSVLIPVWDEEAAIGAVVSSAIECCESAGITVECLVCVDARTADSTADRAREAGARVLAQQSQGLTAAVIELAAVAVGDVCVTLDGDGQHDGGSVARIAGPVLAGIADLVVGERDPRLLRNGFGPGIKGSIRYVGARLIGGIARVAVARHISDPLTGMFACRRQQLVDLAARRLDAPPSGFKILLGLVVATPPGRIQRTTVPFLPRDGGGSKLGFGVTVVAIVQLLRLLVTRNSRWVPTQGNSPEKQEYDSNSSTPMVDSSHHPTIS